MKVLLLIAIQVFIACSVSGTTNGPDTSHNADVTRRSRTTIDAGTSESTGTTLRADAPPFIPQARTADFQPEYPVASTHAFRTAPPYGPNNAGIWTHSVPFPAYTPLASGGYQMRFLKNAFYSSLRQIINEESVHVSSIHPPLEHSVAHMDFLHDQLERNMGAPVLPIEFLPFERDPNSRVYAYMVEATPDRHPRVGISPQKQIRWAILEVYPGVSPRVNILAYLQTTSLDTQGILARLQGYVGSRTHALRYILRRVP
ncbi:uncharacterized protein UTRI_06221_B [Ustilago trichophora]|uniref:Effector family protein Eff1 n=1 Tax=Ustilago trichophora TaxID=86804 RepID=A0A5C3EL16_9BASI|nr:uncharacterized protein UTRI_06221_B [Ustilago trichophora]